MRAVKKTEKKDGQNAIIEALKALAKEKDISEELLVQRHRGGAEGGL